jgi:hypothetical protein
MGTGDAQLWTESHLDAGHKGSNSQDRSGTPSWTSPVIGWLWSLRPWEHGGMQLSRSSMMRPLAGPFGVR